MQKKIPELKDAILSRMWLFCFRFKLPNSTTMPHNFRNLEIWQNGLDVTDLIYSYCKSLPGDERFNLISQMNRSACSIPSNIAEGSGKRTNLQFGEYLSIAFSSAYELETQLIISGRRQYGDLNALQVLKTRVVTLQKKIFRYREKILNEK